MSSEQRKRLKRCLGKTVNYLDLAIPALAEVWRACNERDELIAARPPQTYVPILDDGAKEEESYTDQLAICLQTMDKLNQAVQVISMRMMGMDHDQLINEAT